MARVKRGVAAKKRRKKFFQRAEGYYSSGSRCYIHVREKTDRGLVFAYRDRKVKKRKVPRSLDPTYQCGSSPKWHDVF